MVSKFGQGFGFLQQQQKEAAERKASGFSNNKPKMYKLWLKPGESARLFWVTDHTDICFPLVHGFSHMTKARPPEKPRMFSVDRLCGRYSYAEDRDKCKHCLKQQEQYEIEDLPDLDKIKGPWTRAVAIVWVAYIAHLSLPEGKDWKKKKVSDSNTIFYIEEINDFRLLIMKDKLVSQIRSFTEGDPLSDDAAPDTLLDREWRYSSTLAGDGANTRVDTLVALTPAAIPEAVQEARKNAPDIDEIILAEYGDSPRTSPTAAHTNKDGLAKELDIDDYEDSEPTKDIDFE